MANGTSSLNPTILGRPLFPSRERIFSTIGKMFTPPVGTPPTTMAGVSVPPPEASFSQLRFTGPLIRTDYGRPPSERPDFRNPAEQWDVRKPIQTATSGSAPQPMAPSFLSPEQQSFYDYSRLSPQSQNVVSSVRQPVQKFEGLPTIEQQFPFQQYREPMAPVTADISGLRERVGIRTAYGMVYPKKSQEAAAQRLAQMPAMGARLAETGKELSQAEKITQMRQRGRQLALERSRSLENEFRRGRLEMAEARNLEQQRLAKQMATNVPSRSEQRRAERQSKRNEERNRPFLGWNSGGAPIVPIPDGQGGYVVPNEEGGYTPYG